MIKGLKLTNFQKHAELKLGFTKEVNIIVGPTDSGKSSIIRALRWVLRNDVKGTAFIKWGSKAAEVKLRLGEKVTITRQRSRTENKYYIGETEFAAFGNGVPEEIEQLLNVSPINIQSQFDKIFWFQESAGEVNRQLNQIVDLSIIDQVSKEAATNLRSEKNGYETIKEQTDKLRASVKETEFIEVAKEEYDEIVGLRQEFQKKLKKLTALRQLLNLVPTLEHRAKRGKKLARTSTNLQKLVNRYTSTAQKHKKLTKLNESITLLKNAPRFDESLYNSMVESKSAISALPSAKKLRGLVSGIQEAETEIKNYKKQLKDKVETLNKRLDGQCPVCGGKLHEADCSTS